MRLFQPPWASTAAQSLCLQGGQGFERILATMSMVLENEKFDFRTGKSGTLNFGSFLSRMTDHKVDDKIPLVPR